MIAHILRSTAISNAAIKDLATVANPCEGVVDPQAFVAADVYDGSNVPQPIPIPFEDSTWLNSLGITTADGEVFTVSKAITLMLNFEMDVTFDAAPTHATYDGQSYLTFEFGVMDAGTQVVGTKCINTIAKRPIFVGDGDTGTIEFTDAAGGFDDCLGKTFTFTCSTVVSLSADAEFSLVVTSTPTFTIERGRVVATKI